MLIDKSLWSHVIIMSLWSAYLELNIHIVVKLVGEKVKVLGGSVRVRRLSIATWKFSGLKSRHKHREVRIRAGYYS